MSDSKLSANRRPAVHENPRERYFVKCAVVERQFTCSYAWIGDQIMQAHQSGSQLECITVEKCKLRSQESSSYTQKWYGTRGSTHYCIRVVHWARVAHKYPECGIMYSADDWGYTFSLVWETKQVFRSNTKCFVRSWWPLSVPRCTSFAK